MNIKEVLENHGYTVDSLTDPFYKVTEGDLTFNVFKRTLDKDNAEAVFFISKEQAYFVNLKGLTEGLITDYPHKNIFYDGVDLLETKTPQEIVVYLKLIGAME